MTKVILIQIIPGNIDSNQWSFFPPSIMSQFSKCWILHAFSGSVWDISVSFNESLWRGCCSYPQVQKPHTKSVLYAGKKTLSFRLKLRLQTSEQEKEDVYKKYHFSGSGEVTMDYREFGPPLHLFLEGLLQDFYLMIMGKKSLITLQSLFCSSSCGY